MGGSFVLEALAMLFPDKTYIMWDHDAAPTSLWDVQDIAELYDMANPGKGTPLVYAISENNSALNAGIVIFPCQKSITRNARSQP